ncbi:MAG: ATP-binding protein [Deltaproteobacteria bacterium]
MSVATGLARDAAAEIRDLERRLQRAEHLASLNTLLAGIVHNLGNPLTTIRTFVELVPERWESDPEFRSSYYALALEELQRVSDLVASITRAAVAPAVGEGDLWPVGEMLRELELHTASAGSVKGLRVRAEAPADLPDLLVPREVVKQVLTVLLDNAVAFSPEGGVVDFRARVEGGKLAYDSLIVEVLDAGKGVPLAQREEVFKPFFTTRPGGMGVGLFVARCLARAYGGEIEVADGEPSGGHFLLRLPLD